MVWEGGGGGAGGSGSVLVVVAVGGGGRSRYGGAGGGLKRNGTSKSFFETLCLCLTTHGNSRQTSSKFGSEFITSCRAAAGYVPHFSMRRGCNETSMS